MYNVFYKKTMNRISSLINKNYPGFGRFWKVMEIYNAIFQDLESFGKGTFFTMAM